MEELSQVGASHVPVETCAYKCCMRMCVNVFSQGVKMAAQNI